MNLTTLEELRMVWRSTKTKNNVRISDDLFSNEALVGYISPVGDLMEEELSKIMWMDDIEAERVRKSRNCLMVMDGQWEKEWGMINKGILKRERYAFGNCFTSFSDNVFESLLCSHKGERLLFDIWITGRNCLPSHSHYQEWMSQPLLRNTADHWRRLKS